MRAFTRGTAVRELRGIGTPLPIATINGIDAAIAVESRGQRRTLAAAAESLAVLRELRIKGHVHVRDLPVEPAAPEPSIVDAAIEVRVELASGLTLVVMPHVAGAAAAVFFAVTPHRCWVIELDDLASTATTLLTMTAERIGDTAWAARHGLRAAAVRLLVSGDSRWQLEVAGEDGYVVAEPNGSVVRITGRGVDVVGPQELARTAADLTRDAASLLLAA